MNKKSILTFVILFMFIIFNCSKNNPTDTDIDSDASLKELPRALTQAEVSLIESDNKFGLKLFKEISAQENDKNLFISPLSVSMALGMTYNGAGGTTEEAMRSTLEYGDMTNEDINGAYKSLIELLLGLDPLVQMQIANSIWYRQGFSVKNEFIDLNTTYFDASVSELDFSDPGAPDIINNWVDDKTNGKITEIIDYIPFYAFMYLVDALYFKGTWKYEFDAENTNDDNFTLPSGSETTCDMMNLTGALNYKDSELFQAVELPYGDGYFSMIVFLPKPSMDIDDLISGLTQENWDSWTDGFSEADVDFYLPKFKLEYELELNDVLIALGMQIAFSESEADFSDISEQYQMYISKVKHKTYVDVNEEGTEAAAVTAVEVSFTSEGGSIFMKVNRPFLFAIKENNSGTIMFMGKIVEPVY